MNINRVSCMHTIEEVIPQAHPNQEQLINHIKIMKEKLRSICPHNEYDYNISTTFEVNSLSDSVVLTLRVF